MAALPKPALKSSPEVPGREPLLFTPGPLTTSPAVKIAMQVDLGSRDSLFMKVIKDVQNGLLAMAGVSQQAGYECVIVQGSGTFAVEATVSSVMPKQGGKLLVLSNGAYGKRMTEIAKIHGIPVILKHYGELEAPTPEDAVAELKKDPSITHVGCIHHETTTGCLNPIEAIGKAIHATNPKVSLIVDSMSGFGCYPIDMKAAHIDYVVSSSNKCIEGVPGFAYTIARREALQATEGNARTLSLDLLAQWKVLEATGQFRFTPPTHTLLAFRQALREHEAEGGQPGRLARYMHNYDVLREGMAKMGFHPYLDNEKQGCIITTFLYPTDPNFDFPRLYKALQDRGIVIYPGKLTQADCFRIGTIGRLFDADMRFLLTSFKAIMEEMGVKMPVTQRTE